MIDAMHDDIVRFGSGDQGIFQARQAQIEAGTAIQTSLRLIDQNIDKFLASVSTILGATQQEISGRSANLNQTISHFNLLIIVTSLLCVLAGAAIFVYVRRAVITRLKRVQEYMGVRPKCPLREPTRSLKSRRRHGFSSRALPIAKRRCNSAPLNCRLRSSSRPRPPRYCR
jgi:hypothetical protein